MLSKKIKLVIFCCSLFAASINTKEILKLNDDNYQHVLENSKITFLAFTADWCPFSQQLLGVFKEFSIKYGDLYSAANTQIAFVDCMAQKEICLKNGVNKYPTMKVFYFGTLLQEYRSARNVEALHDYLDGVIKSKQTFNYQEITSAENFDTISHIKIWHPRNFAGFESLLRAASVAVGNVKILVPFDNENFENGQESFIEFWDGELIRKRYSGSLENYSEFSQWVRKVSSGHVIELTFENAEELVEEGKPFLMLFRTTDEYDRKFKEAILREIGDDYIDKVKPLLVNASVMHFPMIQAGKTLKDIPFLLIDQFMHLYSAPFSKQDIFEAGRIRKFVEDLLSDKLHKRAHGIEVKEEIGTQQETSTTSNAEMEKIEKTESAFKKLEPAKNRYSFAKQEL
ncbi:unnamed protein product [Caenorhabditis angaria]|uniref:Thioredoxin domain-containing protein n=1 Tax=Caenorhabditis angaria TaxID=860376 RepID=A0A9P1IRP0_9PELO|nr:unnamed protein product [Caenorhabditis angaria]